MPVARVGLVAPDGKGYFGPAFQLPPPPPDPTDPPPDPTDPPPDPGDPPPVDPPDPGALAHGQFVTTSNTGPAGLGIAGSLIPVSGGMSSSSHGQVIYGRSFTGAVKITHNNVTLRGCKIAAPIGTHALQVVDGVYGLKVEYCEIHQSLTQGGDRNGVSGIYHVPSGRPFNSIYRCRIHDVADGAKLSGGWQMVESHIQFERKYGSTHNDGIQAQKNVPYFSPGIRVIRNKIIMGPNFGNAAVFITPESGPQYDVLIDGNWLQCSSASYGVAVHGQDAVGPWAGRITISNNKVVYGWNGGPEGAFSLVAVPASQVPRTGNQRVNLAGDVLGSVT